MKDNNREILERAINTYGESNQIEKAVEEIGEFLTAISRFKSGVNMGLSPAKMLPIMSNLQEEIADCIIMMEQMKIIFGEETDEWIDYKLSRLEDRLDGKEEKEEKEEKEVVFIDYWYANECKNIDCMGMCLKCGKCGRKFEYGIMVDDGGTTEAVE